MNPLCRIQLLGGLQVRQTQRLLTRFRTHKTGALLAYLAFYHKQAHPREVLIDLLWPDFALPAGRDSLSTALSSLRHQLEPPGRPAGAVLVADRLTVGLNAAAVTTDVIDFEAQLRAAEIAPSQRERAQSLADALALYAGPLLPGYYEEWIVGERERLAEASLQAVRRLIRLLAGTGELARALDYARQAVTTDPLREEGHRDLMRLYVAMGQPSAALQQYRQLEEVLKLHLGVSPSAATHQLLRQIQSQQEGAGSQKASGAETARPAREDRSAVSPSPPPPTAREVPETALRGTVTFLLTDIEGSTAHWERARESFQEALATHHDLLRSLFRKQGGHVFKEAGDGFLVAFQNAADALACAIGGQRALCTQRWPEAVGALRVRMALHTGDVRVQEQDYHSPVLNRASRLLSAGHGGQILCSEATAVLLRRDLEADVRLVDLGIYRLRDLPTPEPLFQLTYPDMPQGAFPPLRAEAGYPSHLPLPWTRFFGREAEIERLQELLLLAQTRLVTLSGAGGVGKTRLAIETARRLTDAFRGAVWYVPLADLAQTALIPSTLIDSLGLPRSPRIEACEQVVEALSGQPSLLVLDNFEHLVEEGALLVRTLLERLPELTCLLTSRRRLDLEGEHEYLVLPLPTPGSGGTAEQLSLYESVQLLVDRAQAVKPDFQVTKSNAGAVAELCAGLEGIPLAIELAASRAQVLTPSQMLSQLKHRFDFLASRRRDVPQRHRSLRAALDWSYELLTPALQEFFLGLAVFRGGWSLEAAEAVCAEPLALDYLAQLRECSLVQTQEGGGEMRFRLLETLREYGEEKREKAAWSGLKRRHRDYFLALVEEAKPHLSGFEQAIWLDRLETEHDNLRAALDWCLEDAEGAEAGLRLAGALWRFWRTRGHLSEGRQRYAQALRHEGADLATQARADALHGAGGLAFCQGDYETARTCYHESLAIRRELGDRQGIAGSLHNLGSVAKDQGDYETARACLNESLAIYRELGDRRGIATSLDNLGNVAFRQGDYETARACYHESLIILRELGDRRGIAYCLEGCACLATAQQHPHRAAQLYAAAATLRESLGIPLSPTERQEVAGHLAQLRTALGEEAWMTACHAGRALSLEQAIAYARQGLDI